MSDEKMGPKEFSEAIFDALDNLIAESEGLVVSPRVDFPWKGQAEDHWSAEEQVRKLYDALGFKPPRHTAWAPSPAAMFTAVNMLRGVQAGQRHRFIEAIVPAEDPIASAKRTLLEAIVNKDITVTMGAAVAPFMRRAWKNVNELLAVDDLADHLRFIKTFNPLGVSTPATCQENNVYSVCYFQCRGPLQQQALCFMPYVHVCWFCRPPVETELYPNGHLRMMRFSDGYSVFLSDPEAEIESSHVLEQSNAGDITVETLIGGYVDDARQLGDGKKGGDVE